MIGTFGVLSTGITPKRITDVTAQMNASLTADLGNNFNLLPQTPEGQLVKRMAEQVADLWEFGEQCYNNTYPDTASGVSLDNARASTGNFRRPATASVINTVYFLGTPGLIVPAGSQWYVTGSPASIFQTVVNIVLDGSGAGSGSMVATVTGPIPAPATSLTMSTIITPIPGLTGIANFTVAQLGALAESDAAFRVRSAQELGAGGTGTFAGLLKSVQMVPNVTTVYPFTNDTDFTDANGLAPHSVELVVVGGVDQDIFDAIFAAKGAGIGTNGAQVGATIDSQGISHAVKFSRLAQLPIFMAVTLSTNNNPAAGPTYPGNGDALVAAAILAFGATYQPGQTVVTTGLFTPINTVPGVLGATILIGTAFPPVSAANITVPVTSVAQFLGANLTVAHS